MKILAIESSCDETAVAVVEDGRHVLANVIASQVEEHKIYGGVVPEIASRRHVEAIDGLLTTALEEARLTLADMDTIAVTYAPGLIGALLVGVNFAKGLAYATGKPLIPVHHLRAHVAANYIAHAELEPPFLALVVSGGHSHILEVRDYTDYHVLGCTRDDAAGEAFDKAARTLGLPYPGGIYLDAAAQEGNPDAYPFPRPRVEGKPYDFSFSGLKTAMINLVHNAAQKNIPILLADAAASFQKAVVDCLCQNTALAAKNFGHSKIVLAGGVCANSYLRQRMQSLCNESNWTLILPPFSLCGDNAAMVGAQAYYEAQAGQVAPLHLNAYSTRSIEVNYVTG